MVSGLYNDVKIIKGKFDLSSKTNGIFIIFLNLPNNYVMHINSIIFQNENSLLKASIFDSWKTFWSDLIGFEEKDGDNLVSSIEFIKYVTGAFDNDDIYSHLGSDNLEKLTEMINGIIAKFYLDSRVNCKLSIDSSNSLTLVQADIPLEEPGNADNKDNIDKLDTELSKKIAEIESKAEHVLNGRIIISPIKGKHISDVKIGEKIKILLTGNDKINKQVAKSLKALSEENEILPINMRITEKFPMEKKGYYIYGLIAKNILVRIIEEEDVKIETDTIQKIAKSAKTEKTNSDNKTILYIVLLTGILLIILILIFIIL
ncbi:MAG: hypothetical protein V1874_15975 [Spirochaetota bacterium]